MRREWLQPLHVEKTRRDVDQCFLERSRALRDRKTVAAQCRPPFGAKHTSAAPGTVPPPSGQVRKRAGRLTDAADRLDSVRFDMFAWFTNSDDSALQRRVLQFVGNGTIHGVWKQHNYVARCGLNQTSVARSRLPWFTAV